MYPRFHNLRTRINAGMFGFSFSVLLTTPRAFSALSSISGAVTSIHVG